MPVLQCRNPFAKRVCGVLLAALLAACAVDRDRVAAVTEPAQDGASKGVIAGVLAGGAVAAAGAGGSTIGTVVTGAQVGAVGGAAYGVLRASGQGYRVLGPDNWFAFDALGRCRHEKAIRLATPQLASEDARYRDGARMLLAIAHEEQGNAVAAEAMLQALAGESDGALTLDGARADVDQLRRSLQRQRRASQVSITCNP